jgi:hypothetical protein
MSQVQQGILRDDSNDKRSLISESIVVIQIDIHPAGEEPDRHVVHMAPGVSRTTTDGEVLTKSKLGLCSWDEVLVPSDARPGHHPGLPHFPSNNHLEAGRDGSTK